MPINLLAADTKNPVNLLAEDPQNLSMANTFIGELPKRALEFYPGTQENKDLIKDMLFTVAGGGGMKILGKGVGKGAGLLKKIFTSAGKSTTPYETEAAKTAQEYQAATEAAKVPKPGLYRSPVSDLENIEHQLGTHINAEAEHGARAANSIKNRVKDIESFWSDSYNKFENKIKDAKFQMPEQAMDNLSYDTDAIIARIKQGADPRKVIQIMEKEADNAENPFYKNLISKAPSAKDTNASEFLSKYRDFRDAMGGLKSDLKNENILSSQKEKISEAIKKGKNIENQIKETLNQGLGEHKPEYDWLMKGYSEQVFPLRSNPLVKAAKKGKMPDNIIKALRTNESGMDVLRGIVKQDSELLRNVVGQRYIAKPSAIYAPNELTREFLDEMPEFKNLLGKREEILQDTVKRKDISLKNKIEAENKLREIQQAKSKAIKKLMIGGAGAASTLGVPYGYGKISKLFTSD